MHANWAQIKKGFQQSPNRIQITEKAVPRQQNTILETVVNNADAIVVNHCLRVLCSGDSVYTNILEFNRKFGELPGEGRYVIAHDVFGGLFALTKTGVEYFAPDSLRWETLGISYEGFVEWISTTHLDAFYESFLWDDAMECLSNLNAEDGILMYPFLWAKECDVNSATKKKIPYNELLEMNRNYAKQFDGEE
jgi:hypothetical protein